MTIEVPVLGKGDEMSKITERALENAFIELLNEKPINKITISEITDKCGVSRMTFYYHYDDIYDLLKEILMKALMDIYDSMSPRTPWGGTTKKVFRYIKKNNRMFTNIYHSLGREHLEEVIYFNTRPLMNEYVEENLKDLGLEQSLAEEDKDYLVSFYLNGIVAFALNWIGNGMEEDPDAIVAKMGFVIKSGVRGGAEMLDEAAKKAAEKNIRKKQKKTAEE